MRKIPRDAVVALILMGLSLAFFLTTFDIRRPAFVVVGSDVWPRIILVPLFILSTVLFARALKYGDPAERKQFAGFGEWFAYYRNPILCFGLFFLFLLSLRQLGMLLSGILFTFAMQALLGDKTPRHVALYALIALATVGGMWAVFTFGLGVTLPRGRLTGI